MALTITLIAEPSPFVIGDLVRLRIYVQNNGVDVDPTSIRAQARDPRGFDRIRQVYPDGEISRVELGQYLATMSLDVEGIWLLGASVVLGSETRQRFVPIGVGPAPFTIGPPP